MKKCNNCQTVALNDADECCRECWEDKFTEIDELPEADKVSKSAVERVVIPKYTEGVCGDGVAILMDGQPLAIDELLSLLNANEHLLAERQRVLDAIPECEVHGGNCVPHAIEWINARV